MPSTRSEEGEEEEENGDWELRRLLVIMISNIVVMCLYLLARNKEHLKVTPPLSVDRRRGDWARSGIVRAQELSFDPVGEVPKLDDQARTIGCVALSA